MNGTSNRTVFLHTAFLPGHEGSILNSDEKRFYQMKFDDIRLTLDVEGDRSTVYGFNITRAEHPLVEIPEEFGDAYAYQIEIPFIEKEPDWVSFDEFKRPIPVKCIFERNGNRMKFDGAIVVYEESEDLQADSTFYSVTVRVPIDFSVDRKWDEEVFLKLLNWDLEPGIQPEDLDTL